ncbi:MAG TPA: septal ring lytic transglycosylase RlpA family protein [Burkholderiales bacterium]|nr:septal ring lytic transglycosylase RlpA family protein [Burkholderiales bacterium]
MRIKDSGFGIQRGSAGSGESRHSSLVTRHWIIAALLAGMIGGCGTAPVTKAPTRPGGYYLDDGPGANPPANIDSIPDAVPRVEPINRGTARPYVVMGKSYTPMTALAPYKARGIASWYGRRYHGKQTSSGEIYDMYAMTAAHTTLPIPSYVRVTNLKNGRSVVLRVNDRGPFVEGRIIDLSYTAAHRIGVLAGGSAMVEVEAILPDASGGMIASAPPAPVAAPPAPAAAPAAPLRDPEPVVAPPPPMDAPVSAAPAAPLAAEVPGYYLQLGAFGSRENAESFLARMRAQMDWLASSLHIFPRDGLFRVHAGPYPAEAEARRDADRVSQALGVRPFVLTR